MDAVKILVVDDEARMRKFSERLFCRLRATG